MCNFGMRSEDMYGLGLVKKPTTCLTNSPDMFKWVNRKCTNNHRHVQLIGNRAKACEVYPVELCEAIVQGLRDQLTVDGRMRANGSIMHTDVDYNEEDIRWNQYTYDLSGNSLRSDLVKVARKEIRKKYDEAISAATPPLEGKNVLFSLATTGKKGSSDPLKLLFIDVKRAYFYAKAKRPVFIQLPEEDALDDHCGKLERSMCGTRGAASNWEAEYTQGLVDDGCLPGVASPCAFHHPSRDVKCVVHGDDFTFLGTVSALNEVDEAMKRRHAVKVKGRLGPGPKNVKSTKILHRILEWTPKGCATKQIRGMGRSLWNSSDSQRRGPQYRHLERSPIPFQKKKIHC